VKWLLDTNVVSESVRKKPTSKVVNWIAAALPKDTAISVVTLAELRDGAMTTADEEKRKLLTEWIDAEIVDSFGSRMLPVTAEILIDWIGLSRKLRQKGRSRDPADLLIAATARVHNLTLVSRNARHFAGTGVVVYDPWNSETHHTEQA
jgi:predicted nucleic acid-binding protein